MNFSFKNIDDAYSKIKNQIIKTPLLTNDYINKKLESKIYIKGDTITLNPGQIHRMEGVEDSIYLEASTPEMDDVVRILDDYNRI